MNECQNVVFPSGFREYRFKITTITYPPIPRPAGRPAAPPSAMPIYSASESTRPASDAKPLIETTARSSL